MGWCAFAFQKYSTCMVHSGSDSFGQKLAMEARGHGGGTYAYCRSEPPGSEEFVYYPTFYWMQILVFDTISVDIYLASKIGKIEPLTFKKFLGFMGANPFRIYKLEGVQCTIRILRWSKSASWTVTFSPPHCMLPSQSPDIIWDKKLYEIHLDNTTNFIRRN